MKQVFVGATLHTVEQGNMENRNLVIENNKIFDITSEIPTDAEQIDCTGMHITPGFIDAHTHVGVWEEGAGPGPGNHDGNEMTDPISPYVRVLDSIHPEDYGFADARSAGVTTLCVAHGSGNAIGGQLCIVKSYGSEVDKMLVKENAGIKMAFGENPKRAGEQFKRPPNTRMGVAYLVRDALFKAQEYMEKWEQYEQKLAKGEEADKPSFDIGKDALVKLLKREIPARCHAHRADDIRTAIRICDEFNLKIVIEHGTEAYKIKDTIIEKQIPLAIGPMIGWRAKRELLHMTPKNAGIMVNAGALVAIMTDSPFTPEQHLRDSVIFAIREGLPEAKALATVTINPAKILEIDDRVGSLTAGKDADFVIFSGDPFDARSSVIATYIDGTKVFSNN